MLEVPDNVCSVLLCMLAAMEGVLYLVEAIAWWGRKVLSIVWINCR
jgi:hypothetical protein